MKLSDIAGNVKPSVEPHAEESLMKTQENPPANAGFEPVRPSRATRKISKRSKVSGRYVTNVKGTAVHTESHLELNVGNILLSYSCVIDLQEQPLTIRYTDPSGRNRTHTFDFRTTLNDGSSRLVIAKPHEKAARPEFQEEVKAIRAAVRKHQAEKVLLITDAHFTRAQARNASRLRIFRRFENRELSERLDQLLPSLEFPISIETICDALQADGDGFQAVFLALYDGRLSADVKAEVIPQTSVDRGGEGE